MDIVLITSMLRPINDKTIFSTQERINQTLLSIASVRDKIPNAYIVMIEGGEMKLSDVKLFTHLVDYLYRTDVSELLKSQGEATLLFRYLTSDHFNSLKNVLSVSKLSGRYYLTDDFHWDTFPRDKFIICFVPVTWMKQSAYKTRYYRIPQCYIFHFIEHLMKYLASTEFKSAHPDIEHCFYRFNIIKRDKLYSPEILGIEGRITGTNKLIQD